MTAVGVSGNPGRHHVEKRFEPRAYKPELGPMSMFMTRKRYLALHLMAGAGLVTTLLGFLVWLTQILP